MIHAVDHQDRVIKHDFTGFRKISYHRSAGQDKLMSDRVAFGNRGNKGSGKYFRIYDKFLESQGLNPAIRYELELSGDIARQAFLKICDCGNSGEKLSKLITSLIGGCIDFRKRSEKPNATNLKRLKRHEFWQVLLSRFDEPIPLKKPVKPKTIQGAIDHIELQNAPGMQMLRKALGDEKFKQWIDYLSSGTDRLRNTHLKAIQQYNHVYGTEKMPMDRVDIALAFKNLQKKTHQGEGYKSCQTTVN